MYSRLIPFLILLISCTPPDSNLEGSRIELHLYQIHDEMALTRADILSSECGSGDELTLTLSDSGQDIIRDFTARNEGAFIVQSANNRLISDNILIRSAIQTPTLAIANGCTAGNDWIPTWLTEPSNGDPRQVLIAFWAPLASHNLSISRDQIRHHENNLWSIELSDHLANELQTAISQSSNSTWLLINNDRILDRSRAGTLRIENPL